MLEANQFTFNKFLGHHNIGLDFSSKNAVRINAKWGFTVF